MPRLRPLSGDEVIAILKIFNFQIVGQKGSHIKLRRVAPTGERQTLTVPKHREMDFGTLRAIIRQASRYVSLEELRKHFYSNN